MAVRVEGVEATARALRRLGPAARAEIGTALDTGAAEIAGMARAIAPYAELKGAVEVRADLSGFKATGAVGNFGRMLAGRA